MIAGRASRIAPVGAGLAPPLLTDDAIPLPCSISIARLRQSWSHPRADGSINLVELSREKVIGVFDKNQFVFSRQRCDQAFNLFPSSINIVGSVHEELRFLAPQQIRKIHIVHWRAQPDKRFHAHIFATHSKSDPAPETESAHKQRNAWKFRREKIECDAHIIPFGFAAIVFSFAQSRSAKIETQNGKSKRVQGFRRLVNDFVVHRPAKQRMRMANDRGHRRHTAARTPQNRFQAARRPSQKETARFVRCAHGHRQRNASLAQPREKTEFVGQPFGALIDPADSRTVATARELFQLERGKGGPQLFAAESYPAGVTVLPEARDTRKYIVPVPNPGTRT